MGSLISQMACRICCVAIALLSAGAAMLSAGPLEDYVAKPDKAYNWKVASVERRPEGVFAILRLSSQSWRSANDVDAVVWRHWLEVYIPKGVASDTALLAIAGDWVPQKPDINLSDTAIRLKAVTARLCQVPNQPLTFSADPERRRRVEDAIIAFGWARFLDTGDPEWLPLLPMTKSAVKAMDAISEFCASDRAHYASVRKFVLTGASKRGWTTWLTAAVDPRVVGISPHVIDLLNMRPSFQHHRMAYGRYADAVHDYVESGIMDAFDKPAMDKALSILDPYSYRASLRMPKLIVNASGDQFFVLDSWRFYWDQLEGPKWLRYAPNTSHRLDGTAYEATRSFFGSIVSGKPFPQFTWKEEGPGRLRVETATPPQQVLVWRSTNPNARNFIMRAGASAWRPEPLEPLSPGIYVAEQTPPEKGWAAMLVELTYPDPSGLPAPLRLTTGITVVPSTLPYAEKSKD